MKTKYKVIVMMTPSQEKELLVESDSVNLDAKGITFYFAGQPVCYITSPRLIYFTKAE